MPDSPETLAFIRNNFRSVWSLELLFLLKSDPGRAWPHDELVERLRGSDSVVRQSIESLAAAGLVLPEADHSARFAPVSKDLERLAENAQQIYSRRPDAIRRLIILPSNDQLIAFADAFRLRKD